MPETTLLLWIDRIETPIGELLFVADQSANLRAIDWADNEERLMMFLRRHCGRGGFHLQPARDSSSLREPLERYFAGDVAAIDDLPVQTGGTPFQRTVWSELRRIPTGTSVSYGKLAEQIARPTAIRAVGLANGSNPVSVVVPCHRVIGSDGSLTGYGGGLHRKRWLLAHEATHARR